MEVKIYDDNLAAPTFIDDITNQAEDLKFSTKLNGGFHICTFKLKADISAGWDWIINKAFYRIVITDTSKTLFEGRIEDIGISMGRVVITAYGYYANLSDIPYRTAYNDVASVVIKAVLTAACDQISADQGNIDATDVTITSAAGDDYLDIYPQELVDKLLDFSDSTSGKWYFAIWEDRIPYLFMRVTTALNWLVTMQDFNELLIKHRGGNLWNSVYAVYQAGGLARTGDADDANSQAKYFKRQLVIPDLGTVAAAAAQAQRDGALADFKDIWPQLENIVLGQWVYDANGKRYPSSWVRAGDVIRIRDIVPASGDLDAVTRDALRTFYIVETNYDADRGELRIVPDTESTMLDSILAKKVK